MNNGEASLIQTLLAAVIRGDGVGCVTAGTILADRANSLLGGGISGLEVQRWGAQTPPPRAWGRVDPNELVTVEELRLALAETQAAYRERREHSRELSRLVGELAGYHATGQSNALREAMDHLVGRMDVEINKQTRGVH